METHPQGDFVLVLVCALAPQPLNLCHCHLKSILAGHLRDSNSSFRSSYLSLFLRFCCHTVALGRALFWKPFFPAKINESFLSLKKALIRSLHLGPILDCVRAVSSVRDFMQHLQALFFSFYIGEVAFVSVQSLIVLSFTPWLDSFTIPKSIF